MSYNPYDLSSLRYHPSKEELLQQRVERLEKEVIELKKNFNILQWMVKPLIEFNEEEKE